jgi:hypothetical protein
MLPYLLHIMQDIPTQIRAWVHELAIFVIFQFAVKKPAAIASVNLIYIAGHVSEKPTKNFL